MTETNSIMQTDTDRKAPPLPPPRSNMRVTLMHHIEYGAAKTLFAFFGVIGLRASSFIVGKFLRYVGPMLRAISRRGEANLRLVYPDWDNKKVMATIRDVWENLGRTSAEFIHLDKFAINWDEDDLQRRLTGLVENGRIGADDAAMLGRYNSTPKGRIKLKLSDDFLVNFAKKTPAIYVTGHFANWEVLSVVCENANVPCAIIYRAANNALVDRLIIETRGRAVRHRQIPKGPDGARALIDALRERYSLGLLMDQKFTDGIRVPFMGHDALTASAAARMALRFDMPVIPVAVARHEGVHFTMTAHEQIVIEKTGDLHADIKALTMRINQALERDVRANPGQWLWLHRRWGKI